MDGAARDDQFYCKLRGIAMILRILNTGITDEHDAFVEMLTTMYQRFGIKNGLDPVTVDSDDVRAITMTGPPDMLAGEHGVHRLVRVPPGETRRYTTFMRVSLDGLPPSDELVRSYVFHPKRFTRKGNTDEMIGDPGHILDGNLPLDGTLFDRIHDLTKEVTVNPNDPIDGDVDL